MKVGETIVDHDRGGIRKIWRKLFAYMFALLGSIHIKCLGVKALVSHDAIASINIKIV